MALTLVFNDTFTESSNTNLTAHTPDTGTGWMVLTNSANSNTLVNATTDSLDTVFYSGGDSGYTINVGASQDDNQAAELTVKASNRVGPAVQLQDGSTGIDGYYAKFDTGANYVRLYRLDESVSTELASDFNIEGSSDDIRLEIDGSGNLEVFLNDTSIITHTDTTYTGGLPGLWVDNPADADAADDFSAWMGEAGTTVNATSASIDVSTFAANVTVGNGTTVNATLASIDITAYAATVTVNTPTNVSATLASIDVSTNAATVTQTYQLKIDDIENNTATPWASTGSVIFEAYSDTDGSLITRQTGLTTDSNASLLVKDAAFTASTDYVVRLKIGTALGVGRVSTGA